MDEESKDREIPPGTMRSGRVRIIGAESAAQRAATADDAPEPGGGSAGEEPGTGRGGLAQQGDLEAERGQAGEEMPWPRPEDPWAADPDLPHWTDAPTGEIPAVLARDAGDEAVASNDPWESVPPPSWREQDLDWESNEGSFSPGMLADEERPGMLDDSRSLEQPWRFDLPGSDRRAAPSSGGHTFVPGGTGGPAADELAGVGEGRPGGIREGVHEGFEEGADRPQGAGPGGYEGLDQGVGDAGYALSGEDRHDREEGRRGFGERGGEDRYDRASEGIYDAEREELAGSPERRVMAPEPAGPTVTAPDGGGLEMGGHDAVLEEEVVEQRAEVPLRATAPRRRAGGAGGYEVEGSRRPRRASRHRRPQPASGGIEHGSRSGRNVPVAVTTGVLVGVVTLIFFKMGNAPALAWVTVLLTLAAAEGFAAFRRAGYRPATLLGLAAVVAVLLATYAKGQQAVPLVVVLLVVFTLLWFLAGVERGNPVPATAVTLLVFCWVGVFGSYAALMLNPSLFPDRHGIAFLLGAIITSVAYDVGALAVGTWVGHRRLAPSVSPNKTWEGLVGGAVAAVIVAVGVVHAISPWTMGKALALGIVVAVVAPLGDLGESLLKRHLGIKDIGRFLPGHGGFLDRFDGLLFVLPATYYLVKAVHLG